MADVPQINRARGDGVLSPRATVLLIEDERVVRVMLHLGLERLGYSVISAFDQVDAARVVSTLKAQLDVAVIDVRLAAGRSGLQIAPILRASCPGVKIIFTSGKLLDADEIAALRGAPFLSKPFGASILAETIERVLGEDSSIAAVARPPVDEKPPTTH